MEYSRDRVRRANSRVFSMGPSRIGENVRPMTAPILVTEEPVAADELARLVALYFGDMLKFVVDVERRVIAVGGELHADAEALLLENGSKAADVWGGNDYPGRGEEHCLEYTSLINIRPSQANASMEIESEEIRSKVRSITFELVGKGEPLS